MKLIILLSIVLLVTISSRKVKTGTSTLPAKTLGFSEFSTKLRELYKTTEDARKEVRAEAKNLNQTPKALTKIKLKANELYPTQGEIAISKSVRFMVYSGAYDKGSATANVDAIKSQCTATTGDGAFINGPLVVTKITGKPGYAIIDGHHRWVQLFLSSPDCPVYCLIADGEFASVDDALKSGLYLQVLQTEESKTELKSEVGDHNGNNENNQLNLIGTTYSDTTSASGNLKTALDYYYSSNNLSQKVKDDRDKDKNDLNGKTPDLATRIEQIIAAVGANVFAMYQRGEDARTTNISRAVMPQTETKVNNTLITSIPNFSQATAAKKKSKKLK